MAEPDVDQCDPPGGVGNPLPQVVSPLTFTGVLEHVSAHTCTHTRAHYMYAH